MLHLLEIQENLFLNLKKEKDVIKHLLIFIKKNLIIIMNTSLIVILVIGIEKRINLIIYMVNIFYRKVVI